MSNVILYISASVDGFIARRDGDISWLEKYQGGTEDYGYAAFYKNVGAAIMGSKTYDKALTLSGGIDKKMPTYVITHRKLGTAENAHLEFYSGGMAGLVSSIQKKTKKDIWLVGGGQLVQTFLDEGLIDDIILSTIPIILGEGIPLFGSVRKEIDCALVSTRSYASGIVQTQYHVQRKGAGLGKRSG